MDPVTQFTAELSCHFREHGADRQQRFLFGENLHRRVPMKMDGVDGPNTVGMWAETAQGFEKGDSTAVRCVALAPELFVNVVKPGVKFELWDGGFIACGEIIERVEAGWRKR